MDIFVEFSIIIALATVIGGLMRLLKQPLIMGHILTGILVGPQFLNIFKNVESGEIFSLMGISTLLFIVGLSLSPKVIREVGKIALITGLGQIMFTTLFGFLIASAFGFDLIPSLYIAIALTFSSTIIILKLLSDKKDLEKLYGRISIGFLLVQDVVATLILIGVSSMTSQESLISTALLLLIKGLLITLILSLVSFYVLPRISEFFAKSQEYLFLFAIGWGFGLSMVFKMVGFSVEIGALVAGVTLSMSPYAEEISSKLKPLRDFFIIMFFILLGANMDLHNLSSLIIPALVFSIFVLVGNPLIVLVLMELLGYNKRTGFFAGLTVAQISEFSLIIVLMGVHLGHIDSSVLSLVTLIALTTIAVSTYMILNAERIYPRISKYITLFQRKMVVKESTIVANYDVILFGCNRAGYDFIEVFKKLKTKFLAVDFDPEIVSELMEKGINVKYGDAEDGEFLDDIKIQESKAVISTIPDFDVNSFLLSLLSKVENKPITILTSHDVNNAIYFYERGADYVVVPHFIGGQVVSRLAKDAVFGLHDIKDVGNTQLDYLKKRKSLGHANPFS